jgi:4-amino-4-deoxy-L-arabinose transferase-like glycosyltransferase
MPLPVNQEIRLKLLLSLVVALSFFYGTYSVPLFDVDEGAFSEATREMFVRGDFISSYLNGEPRYDKPILIYWLQAASVALFGVHTFSFRLPSILAACGWVWLTFLFVRKVSDTQSALVAAIMVTTSLSISVIAKAATADALLNLFIAANMYLIFLYFRERKTAYLLLAYICMALGFLTKGPVAVLIPFVVSGIFFGIKKQWTVWLKAIFDLRGIGLFLIIAMPWYVAQYLKEGQDFIDGFFLKHNVSRFSGPMEGHAGSLFYYVPIVLIGVLPFTSGAIKALSKVRESLKDELKLFLLIWFLFVFFFFSLSGTKLPHYMNYGLTPLLILTAIYVDQLRSRLLAFVPQLAFFVFLFFLPDLIPTVIAKAKDPFIKDALANYREYFSVIYRVFFLISVLLTIYFIVDKRFTIKNKLLISSAFTVFAVSGFILPILGKVLQEPVREAALLAKKEDYNVVMWHIQAPSFSVYSEKIVPHADPRHGDIVLTKTKYLSDLPAYDLLYEKNGVALARVTKP